MKSLDFSPVGGMMGLSLVSGCSGKTLGRVDRTPETENFHPTNAPLLSQFVAGRAAVCRETYVCFRLRATVASRHCVQPEINGPLHDVDPDRSGEEKRRLAIPGNDAVVNLHTAAASGSIENKAVPDFSSNAGADEHSALSLKGGRLCVWKENLMNASTEERLHRTRVALGQLLRLVEEGVLVRNTDNDGDLMKYMRQSTTLVLALKQAQEVLEV